MNKRLLSYILLANLLLSVLVPTIISATPGKEDPWWDDDWHERKEIGIPINTSSQYAKYQPIDFTISFDKLCWAKNVNEHSIRVIMQKDVRFTPLECQIYDLKYNNSQNENIYIDSCGLVFLIPSGADGNEKYYVYYDKEKKTYPNYPDRVSLIESSYHYEPIPGVGFESSFYGIMEGDYLVYGVNKEGSVVGIPTSNEIAKLKKNTEVIKPDAGEIAASFDFVYYYDTDGWRQKSSSDKLAGDQKLIDGNLMVKFAIVSEQKDGLLKSTVYYKYYFCPTDDKRIHVHCKHEITGYPLPEGSEVDMSYAILKPGCVSSSTVDELNFGRIPKFLHYYNEEGRIIPHELDQNPEDGQILIAKQDDYDLGAYPWVSVDDGKTSKAHAIIFEKNNVITRGENELDGIEIQLYEDNILQFPGFNADYASIYLMKNAYEKGYVNDEKYPRDYVVEFNAEFFTTESGGYPAVAEEAMIYQELIQYHPENNDDIIDDEETEKFNLSVYTHLAPTFPFGSLLSTIGISTSYLTAEIFKENATSSLQSLSACRLPICSLLPEDFESLRPIEKLRVIIDMLDFANLSFFKKVCFTGLEKGKYLIKIFRENPFQSEERQFIGYKIVNIADNSYTSVFCKLEGAVSLSFVDKEKTGIQNVKAFLKKDDMIIASGVSDSDGNLKMKVPCGLGQTYTLVTMYKGFLISEEEISMGATRRIVPFEKSFEFDVYHFAVELKDSSGKTPSFDATFKLISNEMYDPIELLPNSDDNGVYSFYKLYPANYTLIFSYDSFEIREKITIPDDETFSINLHDFNVIIEDNWGLPPGTSLDVSIKSNDFEKNAVLSGELISPGNYLFSNLYEGKYTLKFGYRSEKITETVYIPDGGTKVVFPAEFNFTTTIFDARGNVLPNVRVKMIRGEDVNVKTENATTDEFGNASFSIPPGTYVIEVYDDGKLIAKRAVDILGHKEISVVTTNEPIIPTIIIILSLLTLLGFGYSCYKRKNKMLFFKGLAIILAVIAIVSPWWALHGENSDPHLETTTKVYLRPTEMITITSNQNFTVGERGQIAESFAYEFDLIIAKVELEFVSVMDLLPLILLIGFVFMFISLIFKIYPRKRLSLLAFFIAIVFFIGTIFAFTLGMSILGGETVGSFIGNGSLEVTIPGQKGSVGIYSSWGPSIGYYLVLIATIILIACFFVEIKDPLFNTFKRISLKMRKIIRH